MLNGKVTQNQNKPDLFTDSYNEDKSVQSVPQSNDESVLIQYMKYMKYQLNTSILQNISI